MQEPALTIEASARGVNRIVVHVDRGDTAGGFDMLRRVLLALKELDRRARNEGTRPRQQGKEKDRHDSG